ncbi:diguanylate cyclase/phosphodiesterase [Acetobacter aceti NRIC 0242]|uniref:Histidine kinase n=1 Tax=Acetobacter aceti NBRC 14818 TaxID=887700 RepID=A0AB33IAT0_ACEAC|nr:EAL domain-containing protein [Acetobacter aceti]TCS34899.1 PAS domain S-box-containing protein [Acetobacter aceti NBRC 14818]BCK74522.1 histidine kinase [Acetobacter aceti NBRC 14818]GAN56031.1 diguanylate phosphodiesterase [Acetobacter aceti NBRC 14818]GBO80128.1 diguanylate cyclase/phosphodiesterase [Acetobacter aceti NRIC 0242]
MSVLGQMGLHENDRASASVERRLEQLAALAFAAADVLFEVDRAFRIRHVGGAIQKLTGHTARAVRNMSLFDMLIPSDRIFLKRVVEAFDQGEPVRRTAVRFLHGESENTVVMLSMTVMPGTVGERLVTATILDRGFTSASSEDGFLDRSSFLSVAQRLTSVGEEKAQFNLVMLGLLQTVKNAAMQDTVLGKAVYAEIEAILRLISESGAVTRLGNGAFAYFQKVEDDPGLVAEKIASATEIPLTRPFIQKLPLDAMLMEHKEIVKALNYALEAFADERTRQGIAFENLPDCLAAANNRDRGMVTSCRNIIKDETFFQVLQPILTLKNGIIQHYEVLTRFAEGVARGIANTGDFIQIAEQIGMINTFDLLNCVKTIKLLQQLPNEIKLALNVSGRSVQSAEFASQMMNLLDSAEMKVSPSRLLIEITETRGITNFEGATSFLQWLVKRGHRICLDDFGAGAMSFEYLRRFPVDFVKIDGHFFRNAMSSGRDRILIRAIARCSFELGCRTVAEMIETEVDAALAKELGVECGQGWLFGQPVTADQLLASVERVTRTQIRSGSESFLLSRTASLSSQRTDIEKGTSPTLKAKAPRKKLTARDNS